MQPHSYLIVREFALFGKETNADLRVEGNTDNQPIEMRTRKPSHVQTNWQLSALRATNVVEFFIREVGLDPRKISATAYADTRPHY